jgi:hypothetical protein
MVYRLCEFGAQCRESSGKSAAAGAAEGSRIAALVVSELLSLVRSSEHTHG